MERLLIAFPSKTRKELEVIDSYVEYERWAKVKADALRRQLATTKTELQAKVEAMLKNDVERIKIDVAQKLERLKKEAKNRKIKQAHEENMEKYERKMAVIDELQERKRREEKERQEKKQKEWEVHAEEVKSKASEFKEVKTKEKIAREQEELLKQKKLKEELKKKIEENKDKVEERNYVGVKKLEERLTAKAVMQKKKEEYDERLNAAIESYKFRPKVEADEKRLEQITETMQIRKDTKLDKADVVTLFKDYGYTTDQLMKDLRFKISTVLSVLAA
eukprot:TRINITY_DN8433_c0_g3_i1.p1 TRINITY_DN8433_c0_g3~~TRINITY_DN8433_c0_g3_i1.p1  ORF type:complete len:277 (+),score=122.13 TRINITY_DN8433_c0_g3_i1:833-1663(+)